MGKTISCSVLVALISCFYLQLQFGTASHTITASKSIKDPDVIISQNGVFRLGFFSLANSSNRYVGILNRPLKDFSGILTISGDGNLVVSNGKAKILLSTNVTNLVPNATTAQLLDSGNLSFQHPSNVFLQTMKISTDVKTGRKVQTRSWKSPDDPSDGNFFQGIEPFSIPEGVIWNNNQIYFRTGPWNGRIYIGLIHINRVYFDGFYVVADDVEKTYYETYEYSTDSRLIYYELESEGRFVERIWDAGKGDWINGNIEEWSRGNWSSGCFRTTPLHCQRYDNNGSEAGQGDDGFLKLKKMKVPAFPDQSSITNGECKDQCIKNCSCVAYAYDAGIGCMLWSGDLIDVQKFSNRGVDLYIRLPSSELDKGNSEIIVITTVISGMVVIIIISALFLLRRMGQQRGSNKRRAQIKGKFHSENMGESSIGVKLQQLPLFNFEELATATNNFHPQKKLGQGGFGPVYKGTLDDGKEIAVKRLSKASGQGLEEFMNEVVVISKLQHRNLVKLFGCCVEAEEKMLVYEFMPNKSLDSFLFDPVKQKLLDWRKRFNIIEGISRGLLYLHRDSRLKIIHRDLKASNVLLDQELNPKISDFGIARIFGGDENQANTKRVVGTYGYMSPEYVMHGRFSEKSDVFSYRVLLLEIVSGRRNKSFYNKDDLSLLGYIFCICELFGFGLKKLEFSSVIIELSDHVWKLWNEGNIWDLVDKVISKSESDLKNKKEIWRCIHVGLLCVQEYAKERPTMSTIVSMLNSEISDLNTPKQPAFTQALLISDDFEDCVSFNDVTLTGFDGR
ncbi:hypothetical protein E1A91_D01G034400v1 [Gossypium mustelinum]|uniref:Receptor-like serine/threonine-protein kinase n=1 Tax=Gossypium mustelinum TaxID=34275 RepID=A0A5D2W2Y5_GOSMU|nr:hypothetical protein E1A91_D01G034400v1 [Gossypium mustelinum]